MGKLTEDEPKRKKGRKVLGTSRGFFVQGRGAWILEKSRRNRLQILPRPEQKGERLVAQEEKGAIGIMRPTRDLLGGVFFSPAATGISSEIKQRKVSAGEMAL